MDFHPLTVKVAVVCVHNLLSWEGERSTNGAHFHNILKKRTYKGQLQLIKSDSVLGSLYFQVSVGELIFHQSQSWQKTASLIHRNLGDFQKFEGRIPG